MNDYIEQAVKEIKGVWFENHVAELSGKEGFQVLKWHKPESNFYSVKYILSGCDLFISGDIGTAAYNLTFPATVDELKRCDLSYFTGKLSAFCNERWEFDGNLAQKDLNEYAKDWDMDDEDTKQEYDAIENAISEGNSMESFHYQLGIAEDYIHSDDMDWIWHLGERLPYRLIGYWVGLKMAAEQLAVKNKKA